MTERRRTTGSFEARRTTGSDDVLDRLFVYAALRQGQTARSLIASQIARCAAASTAGAIYAFPLGHAGYVESATPRRVIGEVLWLTDLPATFGLLDAYQGEDFARVITQAELSSGEPLWCWIYALADPDTARHGRLVEHGDWAHYAPEQARRQDGRG